MTLHDLLAPRRSVVVGAWLADVLAAWPSPASAFVAAEPDGFRNPVGRVMRDALDDAFEAFVSPNPLLALPPACAEWVALCTVQPGDAGQAADRVRSLAAIAGRVLQESSPSDQRDAACRALDERARTLAGLASAEQARCRERIAALRAREAGGRSWTAQRRARRSAPGPIDAVR